MSINQPVDDKPKSVFEMTPEEYKAACAALSRPPPRRGIDLEALERIHQGRKATELSREEYAAALRIYTQGDYR